MKTEQEHNDEQCTMNNVQWKKVKLGECCTIHGRIGFRGYTTDDLVEKGYGAITFSPSDIHNFKLCYDDCDYIRELYKDYKIIPFELMYGMRNVSKNAIMKGNEVVILNY